MLLLSSLLPLERTLLLLPKHRKAINRYREGDGREGKRGGFDLGYQLLSFGEKKKTRRTAKLPGALRAIVHPHPR
jgi:hypothetical protein